MIVAESTGFPFGGIFPASSAPSVAGGFGPLLNLGDPARGDGKATVLAPDFDLGLTPGEPGTTILADIGGTPATGAGQGSLSTLLTTAARLPASTPAIGQQIAILTGQPAQAATTADAAVPGTNLTAGTDVSTEGTTAAGISGTAKQPAIAGRTPADTVPASVQATTQTAEDVPSPVSEASDATDATEAPASDASTQAAAAPAADTKAITAPAPDISAPAETARIAPTPTGDTPAPKAEAVADEAGEAAPFVAQAKAPGAAHPTNAATKPAMASAAEGMTARVAPEAEENAAAIASKPQAAARPAARSGFAAKADDSADATDDGPTSDSTNASATTPAGVIALPTPVEAPREAAPRAPAVTAAANSGGTAPGAVAAQAPDATAPATHGQQAPVAPADPQARRDAGADGKAKDKAADFTLPDAARADSTAAPAPRPDTAATPAPQPTQRTTSAAAPQPPAAATAQAPVPAEPTIDTHQGKVGHSMGIEIARRIAGGEESLRVRLSPEQLGKVDVTIAFDDGGSLRATVRTEHVAAADLLRRDTADLNRALDQAGVRTDAQSFRFESGGQGSGQHAGGQHQRESAAGRYAQAASDTSGNPVPQSAYRPVADGRVDLLA